MRHRYLVAAGLLVAGVITAVDIWLFGGLYVIGPLISIAAYAWRGIVYAVDIAIRGVLYQVGWRRLFRLLPSITMGGIGITYLVTNPKRLKKVRGWKGRLRGYAVQVREWWDRRHFATKLAIVAILIGVQLPFFLLPLLFPVGFLITGIAYALRKGHTVVLDEYMGRWYWQRLRQFNRKLLALLANIPGVRTVVNGTRSLKLSFKCGWRLWKYDPRFRDPFETGHDHPVEGRLRLMKAWWLGDWRRYHGRRLLCGPQHWPTPRFVPHEWYEEEDKWYAPFVSTVIVIGVTLFAMDALTEARVIPNAIENTLAHWRR